MPGVDPNMPAGRGGRAPEGFGGFADVFGDIFGDIFGGAGGGRRRRGGSKSTAAPTCATRWKSRSRRRPTARKPQIRIPSWDNCDTCKGSGAKPGTKPQTCTTCDGQGAVHMQPGLLLRAADLPDLPRHRQDHSRALRHLRGAGRVKKQQDAGGEDPGRHRRRHAHPLRRQRRAGHQRRPAGRPLHRDPHQGARGLRARRRRPALRVPVGSPRPRWAATIDVPTLGGKAEIELPEGTQTGKLFRLRGKGIKGVRSATPATCTATSRWKRRSSSPSTSAS